jgi:hypothetical protein
MASTRYCLPDKWCIPIAYNKLEVLERHVRFQAVVRSPYTGLGLG